MAFFTGVTLKKKEAGEVAIEEVVAGAEVIAIYFSAHWCPPCRGFTPVLKKFWEEKAKDNGCVILFVSSDRSAKEGEDYFNNDHGDYFMIPHGHELGSKLKSNCQVQGIPSLCVVDKEGNLKHKDGRSDVTKDEGAGAVEFWKGKL